MAYETVLYDVADRICTITLNRPDRLNAWTRQMHLDLKDAMHTAGAAPEVRAIILTGAGRGFCAGADMGGLQAIGSGASADRSTKAQDGLPGGSTLPEFRMNYSYFPAIPKFIIAAINGPAAGLGMVIPLYADLRFAGESAVFTTAFAQRGLIAEHGVSWLLPRLVGLPTALDLLCSARKFRAPEALAMGLVNRVIPDDKLLAEARAYATLLANTVSPRSVAPSSRPWPRPQPRPITKWNCPFRPRTSRKASRTISRSARHGSPEDSRRTLQTFSVWPAFGCQVMRRRSTVPTRLSSNRAQAVRTRMPAKTVLMSKVPSAWRIR